MYGDFQMNDLEFYKSFFFNEFKYTSPGRNDSTDGIPNHFIGYMKSGSGLLIKDSEKIELKRNDMFYIPKGCKYISYWKRDSEPAVFDSIGFKYLPNGAGVGYKLQKISYNNEIFQLFRPLSIKKEVSITSIGILYTLLGKLTSVMKTEPIELHQQLVNRALELLNENPQRKMSDIASFCGISESTLYNIFKNKLHKTPNTARQEIMCQKATELLITTNMTVEEISRQTGFSSSSYFRKVLFSAVGKTPRQIRKESEILI